MFDRSLVTKERLDELRLIRQNAIREHFAAAGDKLGTETAKALEELYSIYDDGMLLWYAGLWDPTIGAFYYSESARDVEGFLPDIESTVQARRALSTSGITSAATAYPECNSIFKDMLDKMTAYAISLQDEDGFFYHPQWGKNIGVSRRGRDLSWATGIINENGGKYRYPTPLEKKNDGPSLLPEHLRSIEAFREYLDGLDLRGSSYSVGNLIQSQNLQITAAGDEFLDELFGWYERNQYPENGTWKSTVDYGATNGQMKVSLMYAAHPRKFPNADAAFDTAVKVVLLNDLNASITSFYNPWITISFLIGNVEKFDGKDAADRMRAKLLENAPEMIRMTKRKIERFKQPDGGFSYYTTGSSAQSQGAPVAMPEAREGDVNGNGLSSTGAMRSLCAALGIDMIPFFTKEDGKLFFELIASSYQAKKITPDEYKSKK